MCADTWETRNTMPTGRMYVALAAVSSKLYGVGGVGPPNVDVATVETYDAATGSHSLSLDALMILSMRRLLNVIACHVCRYMGDAKRDAHRQSWFRAGSNQQRALCSGWR